MKKKFVAFLISFLLIFVVAATVPPESVVPAVAIAVVTAIVVPVLVEGVKLLASKTGKQWLVGKTASSIYAWAIALILVILYYDWKALPPLPSDPQAAVIQVITYGSFIAKAADFVYNAIISKIFDGLAKSYNAFSYKLK
jgi:protein-S-isoprenylcysteine O-methyltransferase Ste14